MENSETPTPQEKKVLDGSLKLAIREEIEKEVEKRIQRQEGFYWKFLALFGAFIAAFAYALWHVQLSELPGVVQKELATQAVMQAKDRIMEIKSSAETVNQNLNDSAVTVSNVLASVSANQQVFTNRLNQIKQQDNVVLVEDLSKLFVVQSVTNLTDGNKIILDYEPIPHTITLSFDNAQYKMVNYYGHSEGKTFIISSEAVKTMTGLIAAKQNLKIEYVRKSLR